MEDWCNYCDNELEEEKSSFVYLCKKNTLNGEEKKYYHQKCFETYITGEDIFNKHREHAFKCSICEEKVRDSYCSIVKLEKDGQLRLLDKITLFCVDCFENMAGRDFWH